MRTKWQSSTVLRRRARAFIKGNRRVGDDLENAWESQLDLSRNIYSWGATRLTQIPKVLQEAVEGTLNASAEDVRPGTGLFCVAGGILRQIPG